MFSSLFFLSSNGDTENGVTSLKNESIKWTDMKTLDSWRE